MLSSYVRDVLVLFAVFLAAVDFVAILALAVFIISRHLSKTEWRLVDMAAILGKKESEGVPAGSEAPVSTGESYQEVADKLTDELFGAREDLTDSLI